MKAAVIHEPGRITIEDVETPNPEFGQVLVKIKAVGISRSDIDLIKGSHPYLEYKELYPVTPGNYWSGIVEKVGEDVVGVQKGERVVGDTAIGCGKCTYCRVGNYHLCFSIEKTGLTIAGAMAECIVVPTSSIYPFSWVIYEEASLLAPFAKILHALNRAPIPQGTDVIVFGSDLIAQAAVQIAKIKGASRVFISDFLAEKRLQLTRKLGANITISIDPNRDHITQIRAQIQKRFVNTVIETTGAPEGAPLSLRLAKRRGIIHFLSHLTNKSTEFDLDMIILKELSIIGSVDGPGMWEEVINLVKDEKIKIAPLITHKFKLKDAPKAFDIVRYQMEDVVAALITL